MIRPFSFTLRYRRWRQKWWQWRWVRWSRCLGFCSKGFCFPWLFRFLKIKKSYVLSFTLHFVIQSEAKTSCWGRARKIWMHPRYASRLCIQILHSTTFRSEWQDWVYSSNPELSSSSVSFTYLIGTLLKDKESSAPANTLPGRKLIFARLMRLSL